MADIVKALPFILAHEGGWADDPDDPGGATMRGVTLAVFLGYGRDHGLQGLDIDGDGDLDKIDLRNITPQKLSDIYRTGYWRFDGLTSQAVATKVFDLAVNMGLRPAIRMAQAACGARVDGEYGSQTEAALNAADPDRVMDSLCCSASARYQAIVASRPASRKFLQGWLRRAAEVPR
nr:glycosyl hydrolase 108 family protein [uncultured Holophaga sp.]